MRQYDLPDMAVKATTGRRRARVLALQMRSVDESADATKTGRKDGFQGGCGTADARRAQGFSP